MQESLRIWLFEGRRLRGVPSRTTVVHAGVPCLMHGTRREEGRRKKSCTTAAEWRWGSAVALMIIALLTTPSLAPASAVKKGLQSARGPTEPAWTAVSALELDRWAFYLRRNASGMTRNRCGHGRGFHKVT
jgi:hypothetical protein